MALLYQFELFLLFFRLHHCVQRSQLLVLGVMHRDWRLLDVGVKDFFTSAKTAAEISRFDCLNTFVHKARSPDAL